jgi:hypothetical protein
MGEELVCDECVTANEEKTQMADNCTIFFESASMMEVVRLYLEKEVFKGVPFKVTSIQPVDTGMRVEVDFGSSK